MNVTREKAFFKLRDQLPQPLPQPFPWGAPGNLSSPPGSGRGFKLFVPSLPGQQAAPLGTSPSWSQPHCSSSSQFSLPWGMAPETWDGWGWNWHPAPVEPNPSTLNNRHFQWEAEDHAWDNSRTCFRTEGYDFWARKGQLSVQHNGWKWSHTRGHHWNFRTLGQRDLTSFKGENKHHT